ncbi:MAG: molybdopterin-dependent oxidoreductase [Myxococcota bacterium]
MSDLGSGETRTQSTFCRLCEPQCPLVVETRVRDEQVLAIRPDHDHPVSKGFACHKGTGFAQVHHDPNRINHPLKRSRPRTEAGSTPEFDRVNWDDAFSEIGARLRGLREDHGPEAIGCYWGNPLAYTSTGISTVYGFWEKMESTRLFGGLTQDLSNKFAAMESIFGNEQVFPVPDLHHTEFFLCLGSDPSLSHMTSVSVPDALGALRGIRDRGGKTVFVNPRRIRPVDLELGSLLQIRPDTDLYLLAALLNEIDEIGGFDEELIRAHGKGIDALRAFIAPWTPERVARVTGLSADDIRETAHGFSRAGCAIAHMGTGGNMGRQGTAVYWLLTMLNFVTGNLGRSGGGLLMPSQMSRRDQPVSDPFFDSPVGSVRRVWGHVPGNLLADYIDAPVGPLRALIVVGGNPIMAIPGEQRLREAFPKLELIVTIDLYKSATAELSDFVLPASDWLERADFRQGGVPLVPTAQHSEAVVSPKGERAEEWWILARIEQELGLPNAIDDPALQPERLMDEMAAQRGTSITELGSLPSRTKVLLPVLPPGSLQDTIVHPDGFVDCCPSAFSELMGRAHTLFSELEAEPEETLKLIQWRNTRQHNSWGRRLVPQLRKGRFATNPLLLSAEEAEARGFAKGDRVRVKSAYGEVETRIEIDAALRRGVAALSHGYGDRWFGESDSAEVGVNVNRLLPSGPGSFEHFSNMAHMLGIPIEIMRADTQADSRSR